MRFRCVWLLLFPLLAGCYRYTAVEPAAVQPGTSIRARVAATDAERLEPLIGTTDARLLYGVLLESDSDAFLVQVPSVLRPGTGQTLSQRVSLPRTSVLEMELRRLDRTRTWGLVALGLVAGAFVTYQAFRGEPEITGPDNGGGGGSEARIPVRIPRW